EVDVRVASMPTVHGENLVLRLLDKQRLTLDINEIGLYPDTLDRVKGLLKRPNGLMLVTGPTGSGKTVTLYTALNILNEEGRNISTVEDPVEIRVKGINQVQQNVKQGMTFARALRSFLRQDPDVIMVGEIRDLETAEIAMRAALTGHLVLSTLHTNSAAEAITRLLDMGLEPYLINSCVSLFVAQRLLKTICPRCKAEATATDLQREILRGCGISENLPLFRGEGCNECNGTGYKGRVPIYELMPMCNEIRALISKSTPAFEIENKAKELGLITLESEAFKKVQEGITSLDECVRVVF
ncbi:MAG: type II/IV secretion system protein, partial [Deltaproteobacteria bacterium]|nr:type II/IV secretion system protein [Deltaproteobacteria bacterium]